MRADALIVVAAVATAGCYGAHVPPSDAGQLRDAPAGDAAACAPIGGYDRCGCSPVCEPFAYGCRRGLGVCLPGGPSDRAPYCRYGIDRFDATDENERVYCWNGQVCAVPPVAAAAIDGFCVDEVFCDAAAAEGFDVECVWSDGTRRVHGPPRLAACPDSADPNVPFCGGPCGECPLLEYPAGYVHNWELSCIGLSDDRGHGVCTLGSNFTCRPGRSAAAVAGAPFPSLSLEDAGPYACLVFREPALSPELASGGWATLRSSCVAYRERFPDAVECMDDDWAVIP